MDTYATGSNSKTTSVSNRTHLSLQNIRSNLKRYASEIGSGAVIYKLGFEIDHIVVIGVYSVREAEVLYFLEQ
jgi:hypothetical protein